MVKERWTAAAARSLSSDAGALVPALGADAVLAVADAADPNRDQAAETDVETGDRPEAAGSSAASFSAERMLRAGATDEPNADARNAALTRREREVLRLLAGGLSNSEIADRLFISVSTTKVHVHHILKKLRARNRVEAAVAGQRYIAD